MNKITERTWVPLAFLFVVVVPIIGGSAWLTSMYNEVQAHGKVIAESKVEGVKVGDRLSNIERSLYRIEGRLGIPENERIAGK